MKKPLILLFLFAASLVRAQDVTIQLTPFVLEIPQVNRLQVIPQGGLIESIDPNDSTKTVYSQEIVYYLIREDGRPVESGKLVIPEQFADLLVLYKKRQVTPAQLMIINAYLQGFNSRLKALQPPPTPTPE